MILYKLTPLMMVTNVLTAPLLVALMWDIISHTALLTWLAVMLIACSLTSISYLYLKPFFKDLSSVPQRLFYYQAPLVFGIIWGAAGYYFFSFDSMVHLSSLFIFLFAIASSALIILSSLWWAYILFIVPTILPFIILFFIRGDSEHTLLAVLIIIFVGVMIFLSRLTYGFISRLIEMRYENAELLIALEKQKNEAIEANRDKSRFLSAASHDLRQPVHSLSLLTSAIEPEIKTERGQEILSQISLSNEVMLDLLNSLLDISKLDAEIIDVNLEPVDVQKEIRKVIGEFQIIAEQSGLELRTHTSPYYVKTDPILLENIIRNLLQNAIRYTKKGKILVACRKQKEHILLQVWDTGKGIAPEHQKLIFAEFQQLQNPERDQNKGLGLGLAICRRLADLIGAALTVESNVGRGSVFTLKLPAISEQVVIGNKTKKTTASDKKTNTINFEEAVILVIDDNKTVRNAMTSLLEGWGCEVLTADSIEETVEVAKSYQGRINAIIADYRLRENTTGVEAMNAFNERVDYQTARVLITGDTSPDRMKDIVAHGIPVLHKPIKSGHLKTALGSMLRNIR